MIVRGEGKSKSATAISLVDRKARKVYVEGFTYFKSDGTELQRPIDASNLVIINPDWSDIRRRKILNRINESVEWTDDVISDLEAAEDEYEAENVEPSEEKADESGDEEVTEEKASEGEEVTEEAASEETDYSKMSVAELKVLLKEKKLPVSGKKADLIDRLQGDSK